MQNHENNEISGHNSDAAFGGCPVAARSRVSGEDCLRFDVPKRVTSRYATDADGQREFHIYYGAKEVVFDEPDYFEFGETLAKQKQFTAESATTWGPGYPWLKVQQVFEALLAEGVLSRVDGADADDERAVGTVPARQPRAPRREPKNWTQCSEITQELAGHAVELGFLELIIPVYRIAHPSLDADGRQVGEANVFPPALRLDIQTDWRTCYYSGSRAQDVCPMNVTALKAMTKHWKQIMATLSFIRKAYLERYPAARERLSIGDIERLSVLILALPTYLLVRPQDGEDSPALSPVLSSMFRVTDGLRIAAQAMTTSETDSISPSTAAVTCADIVDYCERNLEFVSAFGVCAGPQHLIEEFLRIVVDGEQFDWMTEIKFDPDIQAALADLDSVFEYGLLALRASVVAASVLGRVAATYAALSELASTTELGASAYGRHLTEMLSQRAQQLSTMQLGSDSGRKLFERRYCEIYETAGQGLIMAQADRLPARLEPYPQTSDMATQSLLRELIAQRLEHDAAPATDAAEALASVLMDYFKAEQAIVRSSAAAQDHVNAWLNRAAPGRLLSGKDLAVHNQLVPGEQAFPYVEDDLKSALGIDVSVTSEAIRIAVI